MEDKKLIKNLQKRSMKRHEKDKPYKSAGDREFVLYLAAVLIIAFAIRLFVFEPVRVDGASMYDTLLDGERMAVEKVTYMLERPKRGDIIICFYPGYTVSCVKRVIGLPGDTVEVSYGQLYINDELINEDEYIDEMMLRDYQKSIVPEDCVLVMGDNRNGSLDSRSATVGPIPYYRIVGKARAVIFPLSDIRPL